jgi:hypothetical protein
MHTKGIAGKWSSDQSAMKIESYVYVAKVKRLLECV